MTRRALTEAEIAPIAARINSAHESFVETLRNISGCSEPEAIFVKDMYLKHNLAKLDAVMGRITVKHGAYLDEDMIRNTINMQDA